MQTNTKNTELNAAEIRTQLRLPTPLHAWLRQHCKQQNRSMNGQIVEILTSAKRQTEESPS